MKTNNKRILLLSILLIFGLACSTLTLNGNQEQTQNQDNGEFDPILEPAVDLTQIDGNEPVYVTGTIPFTSPFFLNSASEPFVLLEDQAGFVARDKEFVFPLEGQAMGPVEQTGENELSFSLTLPAVPQGTMVDVDHNGKEDRGLMVFAVAYWSNIWGGPFLEEREGTGWSSAHATTTTDPDREYEIDGGYLFIWAPDDQQSFPVGFGPDNMLFTEDDPIAAVPPGYSIVDLNAEPFNIYKQAHSEFELVEGSGQVKDYSAMSYGDAFNTMFEKVSIEYPFTKEKGVDWQALYDEFASQAAAAQNDDFYYRVLREFIHRIPDAHVGISFNAQIFYEDYGGSFGLRLAELDDGSIIAVEVLPETPAAGAGIVEGAEIISWGGRPVLQALDKVESRLGPHSTPQHRRQDQLIFLTRYPVGTTIEVEFANPQGQPQTKSMTTETEYDSLFNSLPYLNFDPVELPIEGHTLEEGIGYIKITTFSDDLNLMAQIWERHIENLIDEEVPALIIDLRTNFGGSGGLANNFAGYLFDEEITVSQNSYYNHELRAFEYNEYPTKIKPAPLYYPGQIAVLVSPNCISACEGFAYWLTLNQRATIIGHAGTAGAFGEVGRGQYKMPGDYDMQFPTGRPETFDGHLLIEGTGVQPDILIPVTYESAMGIEDPVLQAAVEYLRGEIE